MTVIGKGTYKDKGTAFEVTLSKREDGTYQLRQKNLTSGQVFLQSTKDMNVVQAFVERVKRVMVWTIKPPVAIKAPEVEAVEKKIATLEWLKSLKVGDIVEARFTNNYKHYRFKAKIDKVNQMTFRVLPLEKIGEAYDWPSDRTFVIPRMGSRAWSVNNGVFPHKKPDPTVGVPDKFVMAWIFAASILKEQDRLTDAEIMPVDKMFKHFNKTRKDLYLMGKEALDEWIAAELLKAAGKPLEISQHPRKKEADKPNVSEIPDSPVEALREIKKRYPPTTHFIFIYDAKGIIYNYHNEKEIRVRLSPGGESIKTYSLENLLRKGAMTVIVHERSYSPRGGLYWPEKMIYKKTFTSTKTITTPPPTKKHSKKIESGRDDIIKFFESKGFYMDRYGNLKKKVADDTLRVKLQDVSFRVEIKYKGDRDWRRRRPVEYFKEPGQTYTADYYSKYTIVDGKLALVK